jgi:hypothetical protein
MTVRTSRKSVTFTRPFSLSGIDEVQPAGTYTVETDEELLPGLSFPAYRRLATLMVLRSRGGAPVEVANIDPLELQAAQDRDAALLTLAPTITAAISPRAAGVGSEDRASRCAAVSIGPTVALRQL